MWIFTRYGFYSVACAGRSDGSVDKATLMVRARCKDHLEKLRDRFPTIAEVEIVTMADRDYRYRIILPKAVWLPIVVLENLEVADKLGGCLPSFDSHGRHFSVVLTTAFVVVRSSQNCITLQGSHYYQATVGLNVAVNPVQLRSARMSLRLLRRCQPRVPLHRRHHPALSRQDQRAAVGPHRLARRSDRRAV